MDTDAFGMARVRLEVKPSMLNDGSTCVSFTWDDAFCHYQTIGCLRGGETLKSITRDLSKYSGNGNCVVRKFHIDLAKDLMELCGKKGKIISAQSVLAAASDLNNRWQIRALRMNMVIIGVANIPRDSVISILDECYVQHVMER